MFALLICFTELLNLFDLKSFTSAFVFSDSIYAINQVTSSKHPASNFSIIKCLREVYCKASSVFKLNLYWIKGHSIVGGNVRVDYLSKIFASRNCPNPVSFNIDSFLNHSYLRSSAPWVYGFPLTTVPLTYFTSLIACFPWPTVPMSMTLSSTDVFPPVSVVSAVKNRKKRSSYVFSDQSPLRRSKRLSSAQPSPGGFYNTAIESLDFKHSD